MNEMLDRSLPPAFLQGLRELETSYLEEDDPIRQSGFAGGAERWRAERESILEPIREDGDFLDIGCANGYLLECLLAWGDHRGVKLTPYGLDQSAELIGLARRRLPQYAENFYLGNAWDWRPPTRYRYVYSVHDCVPDEFLGAYVDRLMRRVVAPGGLLIIGSYGSRSRGVEPLDVSSRLAAEGNVPLGQRVIGNPPISRFAWLAA